MRQTVAIATFRDRLVLLCVTRRAGNFAVLGLAISQGSESRIVTGSAKLRCRAVRISNGQRHMGLVTGRTVCLSHRLGVTFVAGHTLGNVAMGIGMTEVTGKGLMHARVGNHLLFGPGVTTHANGLLLARDADVQGLMGIMATKTIVYLIMCTAFMALTALGDIVCYAWPVSGMTGRAVDFGFVGGTVCLDFRGLFTVTFDTVIGGQNCLCSQSRMTQENQERYCENCDQQVVYLTLGHHTSSLHSQKINNPKTHR